MFCFIFPLQTKSICTVRTAKKISLFSAIIFFGFNAQFLFIFDTENAVNGEKRCIWVKVPDGYKAIYLQIDAFLYSFIPLLVMFTSNCLIILKFMMAKWKNRHGGTRSVNQALSKSAVKGTVMLLTISFAFIILTGPISIAYSIMDNPPIIVYGITVILQYLNHSINGVLYCITGSKFRHELTMIFCCHRNDTNRSTVYSMSHMSTSSVNVSQGVGHI